MTVEDMLLSQVRSGLEWQEESFRLVYNSSFVLACGTEQSEGRHSKYNAVR